MSTAVILQPRSPDLSPVIDLAVNTLTSAQSRRVYAAHLRAFLAWASGPVNRQLVQAYRASLIQRGQSPSSINQALSAIRLLVSEASESGYVAKEVAESVASIKGVRQSGVRSGNWLSLEQARALLALPDQSLAGKRDRALLYLLIGSGIRRDEAARLTVDHLQQRGGRWVLLDIVGKGGKVRTVPVNQQTVTAVQEWLQAAGIAEGSLLRSLTKHGTVRDGMSASAIYAVVVAYAKRAGVTCRPHDCRRTFAHLAIDAGSPDKQVMISMGHANLQTFSKYLGRDQDLKDSPADRIDL